MSYYSDVYSSPEKHGLQIFAEISDPSLSYEFDMVVVWVRVEDGALFFGSDSGCSCPSPFEYQGIADLARLDGSTEAWNAFTAALDSLGSYLTEYERDQMQVERTVLEANVLRHLRESGVR